MMNLQDDIQAPLFDMYLLKDLGITAEESSLKNIIHILSMAPSERSRKNISILRAYFSSIEFFRKKKKKESNNLLNSFCQYMKYEIFPSNSFVCRIGEEGDKFYIVLHGEVKVLVVIEDRLTEVAKLRQGQSFGELALTMNQPRMATIQCITRCHFATLDKENYNNVLGKESEKHNKFIQFLKSIPIFTLWSGKKLEKFSFHFKQIECKKFTIVFKEDTPANHVYIVKKGDFLLYRRRRIKKSVCYSFDSLKKSHIVNKCPPKTTERLSMASQREIIGDYEVRNNLNWEYSCVCNTEKGLILSITKKDFLSRVKDEESFKFLDNKNKLRGIIRDRTHREIGMDYIKSHISYKKNMYLGVNSFQSVRHLKKQTALNNSVNSSFNVKAVNHIKTGLTPPPKTLKRKPSFKFKDIMAQRLHGYFKKNQYSPGIMKRIGLY